MTRPSHRRTDTRRCPVPGVGCLGCPVPGDCSRAAGRQHRPGLQRGEADHRPRGPPRTPPGTVRNPDVHRRAGAAVRDHERGTMGAGGGAGPREGASLTSWVSVMVPSSRPGPHRCPTGGKSLSGGAARTGRHGCVQDEQEALDLADNRHYGLGPPSARRIEHRRRDGGPGRRQRRSHRAGAAAHCRPGHLRSRALRECRRDPHRS